MNDINRTAASVEDGAAAKQALRSLGDGGAAIRQVLPIMADTARESGNESYYWLGAMEALAGGMSAQIGCDRTIRNLEQTLAIARNARRLEAVNTTSTGEE